VKPSSQQRLQEARQRVQQARQEARERVSMLVAALRAVPGDQYAAALAGLLAIVLMFSGIGAYDPGTWLLENTPVALGLFFLGWSYRVMPLSRVSYTLIFLFLCLHETGAHWTYSRVPYDVWWEHLFGVSLNSVFGFDRNHFDRLVHFSYGLLLAYPIREVFLRVANAKGFWGYFLPLDFTMSTSALYELLEWATASVVGSHAGNAFLGSQGDPWDAQKDIAMASLGALIAMTVIALITSRYKRDFAREFGESLRVKVAAPLGEEALARLQMGKTG
jgi:putative membrane protein